MVKKNKDAKLQIKSKYRPVGLSTDLVRREDHKHAIAASERVGEVKEQQSSTLTQTNRTRAKVGNQKRKRKGPEREQAALDSQFSHYSTNNQSCML